ncbi:BrnA antitoxin family protein [Agrobacterium salinitolerans]|uniref:BrnA antitoxin family protein n=1 Tax=Agrobacterium salinitolerans TaxID=1183413 RepID=UPI001572D02D|nr:BrnA antitoxin family protein [Agrobacterium salinitolerans]NTA36273.1 BrnA antitoxin family protein [Agrobacterium salinitolerans]
MAKVAKLKEFKPGRGYTEADWDAVDFPEMTDQELANACPARDVLPPAFFEAIDKYRKTRGRPPVDKPKKQVTLRLDEDVVERFREGGKGWQSRINEALRKAAGI